MNEITKVHLGRQAFTIAVDAHKELQEYLRAIKRHMGGTDDAVEEVEIRMAELLLERGIHGDKVVLTKDVKYLKEQLGEPGDFGEEEEQGTREDNTAPRRLFRDTDNAMLAGVAAGIGKYFGIDPIWIRLAFIALTFAGASGVLIYVILWLIIPEAKTSSERLQMQGKPVTVGAIKDVVERADVQGAAHRAQHVVGSIAQGIVKVILGVVGFGLMLAGIGALLGLTTLGIYWALNHDLVPAHVFPVGTSEVVLICVAFVAVAMVALFFLITGLAVTKRKWPLPGWALGAIIAVFLASVAVSGALVADAAPRIKQRYEAAHHTYTRTVPEFHKLHVIGNVAANVQYEESLHSGVTIKYWGDADFSAMKADVKDQMLTVDATKLAEYAYCEKLCLFHPPFVEVIIRGPKLEEVTAEMQGTQLNLPHVSRQTIKVRTVGGWVSFPNFTGDNLKAARADDNTWTLTFAGGYQGTDRPQEVSIFENTASIAARNVDLTFNGECGLPNSNDTVPHLSLYSWFQGLTVNGTVVGTSNDLQTLQNKTDVNAYKCLDLMDLFTDS